MTEQAIEQAQVEDSRAADAQPVTAESVDSVERHSHLRKIIDGIPIFMCGADKADGTFVQGGNKNVTCPKCRAAYAAKYPDRVPDAWMPSSAPDGQAQPQPQPQPKPASAEIYDEATLREMLTEVLSTSAEMAIHLASVPPERRAPLMGGPGKAWVMAMSTYLSKNGGAMPDWLMPVMATGMFGAAILHERNQGKKAAAAAAAANG